MAAVFWWSQRSHTHPCSREEVGAAYNKATHGRNYICRTYFIKIMLRFLFHSPDVLHRHSVPLIKPAKHLAVEVPEETRVYLYTSVCVHVGMHVWDYEEQAQGL